MKTQKFQLKLYIVVFACVDGALGADGGHDSQAV